MYVCECIRCFGLRPFVIDSHASTRTPGTTAQTPPSCGVRQGLPPVQHSRPKLARVASCLRVSSRFLLKYTYIHMKTEIAHTTHRQCRYRVPLPSDVVVRVGLRPKNQRQATNPSYPTRVGSRYKAGKRK